MTDLGMFPASFSTLRATEVLKRIFSQAGYPVNTATGQKQRLLDHFEYAAKTWHRMRKVIAKAEHSAYGLNPRYLITSLAGVRLRHAGEDDLRRRREHLRQV